VLSDFVYIITAWLLPLWLLSKGSDE
jgi:hypothetical protein